MENIPVFCLMLAGYVLTVSVCLKYLPGERWQILATVPMKRVGDCSWHGINLTWYGFILATAVVAASLLFLVLMVSLQIPVWESVVVVLILLAICLPASKQVARIVEKKKHTLTVGGASFIGLLAAPLVLCLANFFCSGRDTYPAGHNRHSRCLYPGRRIGQDRLCQFRLLLRQTPRILPALAPKPLSKLAGSLSRLHEKGGI